MSVSTLERWRADALASGKSEGGWTAATRLEAVLATAAMSEEQRAVWCRAKGLYPSELLEWKQAATQALEQPGAAPAKSTAQADQRRVRELERELRRKEKGTG